MRESKIERYLRAEIAKLGGWCEKHTSPGMKGPPDDIVWWPARNYNCGWFNNDNAASAEFIETKAPGGKLSVLQQRDHARRRAMGFEVHVIWNLDQANEYLKSRGKR